MIRRIALILFSLISSVVMLMAQTTSDKPKFYDDIMRFKQQDSLTPPQKTSIVFIGSSSFTLWKDVQQRFPDYRIVNRGFGGSTIADLLYYKKDIIDPYHPKQVVIYCGENDIGSGRKGALDTMLTNLKTLVTYIRAEFPGTHIVYVGMKPSPSRRPVLPMIQQANAEIEAYFKTVKRARFVPVYQDMLLPNGQPNPALFVSDSLHMSAAGYDIWQRKLKTVLKK